MGLTFLFAYVQKIICFVRIRVLIVWSLQLHVICWRSLIKTVTNTHAYFTYRSLNHHFIGYNNNDNETVG